MKFQVPPWGSPTSRLVRKYRAPRLRTRSEIPSEIPSDQEQTTNHRSGESLEILQIYQDCDFPATRISLKNEAPKSDEPQSSKSQNRANLWSLWNLNLVTTANVCCQHGGFWWIWSLHYNITSNAACKEGWWVGDKEHGWIIRKG